MAGDAGEHGDDEKVIEEKHGGLETTIILNVFRKWDVTGDGYISRYELHNALNLLGMKYDHITRLMVEMDTNRDGKISYEEFCYFLDHGPKKKDLESGALVTAKYNLTLACQDLRRTTPEQLDHLGDIIHRDETVKAVLSSVMAILGETDFSDTAWMKARVLLKKPHEFLEKLFAVPVNDIGDKTLANLQRCREEHDFKAAELDGALRILGYWVLAIKARAEAAPATKPAATKPAVAARSPLKGKLVRQ
eukprot:TRINITY_DN48200_c0_g1_i1.p1 TRINITY_DN48200_c0_g1~~TRINITY_DN48200_c0_g1_i1.p1  ORF type:complete len:263 (-),score=53.70 TRINITY_DN48200_c0_g1_i1:72-818(-)